MFEEGRAKAADGESTPVKKVVQNKAKRADEVDVDESEAADQVRTVHVSEATCLKELKHYLAQVPRLTFDPITT